MTSLETSVNEINLEHVTTNLDVNKLNVNIDLSNMNKFSYNELEVYCTTDELDLFSKITKPKLDYVLDSASEGECPYIKISVYGYEVLGLLDSGANKIFINEEFSEYLLNLGIKLNQLDNVSCKVANNQEIFILGYMSIPIKLKHKVQLFDVFIVPSLRHTIILGTVFWVKMGLIPDLRKGEWSFEDSNSSHLNKINLNHIETATDLTITERQVLKTIVDNYFDSMSCMKLGCTDIVEHIIKTDSPPIKMRYYPVSPHMQNIIDKEVDRLLDLDVIERSYSGWSSPILMTPKKDGSYRFCVDFRKLNAVTEKWAYPIPRISYILDNLGNAKFITTLDIQSAFWQIRLADSSKQYTGFTVPNRGLFQFKRMPMGLTNAPATFQALVDKLFGPGLDQYVFKYLDDIVIATPDFQSHVEILQQVLDLLNKAGLTLNKDKCQFCRSELKFLGYVVNRQGLHVDPDKVSAVVNLLRPKTSKEVRRLIGMVMWYKKFIPGLSIIIEPLTNLTRKKVKFLWSPECEQAFDKIKNSLISAPILSCPNFSYEFIVQCDSSSYGLGAVLSQVYNGKEHVICYLSRSLNKCERNYTVTELECLAVLWSVEKLRCYLEGQKFTIITDHHSLVWLNNLKNPQGRLGRWVVRLQQFDYVIIHRPGKYHLVPDCLSRAIPDLTEISEIELLKENQDNWYKNLVNKIKVNPLKYPQFRISSDSNNLYKHIKGDSDSSNWKLVIPKGKRKDIMYTFHNDPTTGGHFGIYKTYHRVSYKYFWPGMKRDITDFVNKCKTCAEHKPVQRLKAGQMGHKPRVDRCWQYIAIDLIGPFPRSSKGNQHVLVVCDYFSKFTLLFPLRKAITSSITRILEEQVFLLFGVPEYLKCDNGVQFKSTDFQKLMDEYNIKIYFNPLYHPEPNFSERANRVIKTMISSYVGQNHKKWDLHLAQLACAYRTARHEVTHYSPYHINFGVEMVTNGFEYKLERDKQKTLNNDDNLNNVNNSTNLDEKCLSDRLKRLRDLKNFVKKKLQVAHVKASHNYNLRHRPVQYKVGDTVWRKEHIISSAAKNYAAKLGKKYTGPFRIKNKLGINVYELEDELGNPKGNWHVSQLKPNMTTLDSDD